MKRGPWRARSRNSSNSNAFQRVPGTRNGGFPTFLGHFHEIPWKPPIFGEIHQKTWNCVKIGQFSWFSRFPPFGLRKGVRICMNYNVFLRVRGRRGRSRTHGENPWKMSFLWKFMKISKFHEISWNIMIFMIIVVSRPSPRRDPRNSMNYCSILQVLGTRIAGIAWIFIFFSKFIIFMFFEKKQKSDFSGFLWTNKFPAHAKLQNT